MAQKFFMAGVYFSMQMQQSAQMRHLFKESNGDTRVFQIRSEIEKT